MAIAITKIDDVKPALQESINAATFQAMAIEGKLRLEIKALKIQKLSYQKRLEYIIENMPDDYITSVWCADLTEDLTGSVGTIETPGEIGALQIQPGYDSNAAYTQTRDGQLTPTVCMTPAQTFYNLAMLPGWQKWKPVFRYATITSVSGDTANITMDATESSQQDLNINQAGQLSNVAIEYMDCNGAAFEADDEVLVKFEGQDWANPKIIGFKSNPKPCQSYAVFSCLTLDQGTLIIVVDLATRALVEIIKDGDTLTQPLTITEYNSLSMTSEATTSLSTPSLTRRSTGNVQRVGTDTSVNSGYPYYTQITTEQTNIGYDRTKYARVISPAIPEWTELDEFFFYDRYQVYYPYDERKGNHYNSQGYTRDARQYIATNSQAFVINTQLQEEFSECHRLQWDTSTLTTDTIINEIIIKDVQGSNILDADWSYTHTDSLGIGFTFYQVFMNPYSQARQAIIALKDAKNSAYISHGVNAVNRLDPTKKDIGYSFNYQLATSGQSDVLFNNLQTFTIDQMLNFFNVSKSDVNPDTASAIYFKGLYHF